MFGSASKILCAVGLLMASFSFVLTSTEAKEEKGGNKRVERLFASFIGAKGKARYEQRVDRHKFNFQIERMTPGDTGVVSATTSTGKVQLGTFTVNGLGRGGFEIATNDGDAVPDLAAGDTITLELGGRTFTGTLR